MNIKRILKRLIEEKFSLAFIFTRLIMKLGVSPPFVFKTNGIKLKLHPSAITMELFRKKYSIDYDKFIIDRFVCENSICIDVGANIGHLSILMAKKAKNGIVIAIEPQFRIFKFMIENICINNVNNIFPLNAAIDEIKGVKKFYSLANADDQSSFVINMHKHSNFKEEKVFAIRLDDLLQAFSFSKVDFLKIDVEGAELFVLKSLGEFIKNVKYIWFEFIEENYKKFNYTKKEIFEFLTLNEFSLFFLNDKKKIQPIVDITEIKDDFMGNLLAVNNKYKNYIYSNPCAE